MSATHVGGDNTKMMESMDCENVSQRDCRMATRFTDVLHETMVALGGDINWFTSKEWLKALHKAGATFVTIAHVRALLRSPPLVALDEHSNPLGFYRK